MKLESTLVFCDAQSSTTDWSHPHHVRTDDTSDAVIFMLAGGLPTPSPLHRKSWLEEIGGWDESLPCSQERDLHLRIAAHGIRYQRLPEILYNVRRVRGSVSSDGSRILEQHEGIALRLMQTLDAKKELTEQRRRALAAFFARDSRRLIQLGNFSTAKRFTKHASKIHPSGGLKDAYGGSTLWLRYLIGAFATEVISGWLRRLKKI